MNKYITVPQIITYNDIVSRGFSLSSSQYKTLTIKNETYKKVGDFLTRQLTRKELGEEVGSNNYIDKSTHFFLRAKALQSYSYLPQLNSETSLPIMPNCFINMDLKEGDLIISKDSNIGEIAILEKSYPNHMLSGAMYKIPVQKYKYYLLAMVKHKIFREQLDFIVPKGATIRHAKTLFLDCKIPMPINHESKTIKFIELLMQAIINKEKKIRQRHNDILHMIGHELTQNQKIDHFSFQQPTIKEIERIGRLDADVYSEDFKKMEFKIKNYSHGCKNLIEQGFSYKRGTSLEKNFIGTRIDSDTYHKGFYELLIPTNISEYGTIIKTTFIGTKTKLKCVKKGDIIFGGEATFKSCVIVEETNNMATNYHGIRLINSNNDITESIFVRCFLEFLRTIGYIKYISVGGQGGHCAPLYFHLIQIPQFPKSKQKEISQLYHNPLDYPVKDFTLDNFLLLDNTYNEQAGIYELDKTAKYLQQILNRAIEEIINNKEVKITFHS